MDILLMPCLLVQHCDESEMLFNNQSVFVEG